MAGKPFTLRIPDEVKEDLKFLSTSMNRTQASIASEILEEKVSIRAKRVRAIQEAKEQAKSGVFVSQEAMENWVESLGTDNELPMPKPDILPNQGWWWR